MRRTLAFGPDSAIELRLLVLYGQEAQILSAMGRGGEAADVSARGVAMREKRLSSAPQDPTRQRDLAVALANHADALRRSGSLSAACAAARKGQALWQTMRQRGHLADRDARLELPKMDAAARAACGG
jgi:serine/threonine-protein kinase